LCAHIALGQALADLVGETQRGIELATIRAEMERETESVKLSAPRR